MTKLHSNQSVTRYYECGCKDELDDGLATLKKTCLAHRNKGYRSKDWYTGTIIRQVTKRRNSKP